MDDASQQSRRQGRNQRESPPLALGLSPQTSTSAAEFQSVDGSLWRSRIRQRVLHRLLAAWLLLSFLCGGLALVMEFKRQERLVQQLALTEAASFNAESMRGLERLDDAVQAKLAHAAAQLASQRFAVVELYDRQRQLVAVAIGPGQIQAEAALNRRIHPFPSPGQVVREVRRVGGELFVRVLVPLESPTIGLVGYFEGVYQLDRQTLSDLQRDVAQTLVIVALAVLLTTALMYPVIRLLIGGLERFSRHLMQGNIELLDVLGTAIAERDNETNAHNYRVAYYSARLGEALGLSSEHLQALLAGAFLHDVGKIGIPDAILNKRASLTEAEFAVMRNHVAIGVKITGRSGWLKAAREVIEFHHERFDGSGYLRGLRGDAIPLAARIFAVADVFDALTSRRVYKEPWPLDDALRHIEQASGKHFDPGIVVVFARIARQLHEEIQLAGERGIERQVHRLIDQLLCVKV
jgi:HD-GYP domain-containing protein (c-di-GMP phosphodiesterase class II)